MDMFPIEYHDEDTHTYEYPEEDFIDEEENGGVRPHVEGIYPAVLAVVAQGDPFLEFLVVVGTTLALLACDGGG